MRFWLVTPTSIEPPFELLLFMPYRVKIIVNGRATNTEQTTEKSE